MSSSPEDGPKGPTPPQSNIANVRITPSGSSAADEPKNSIRHHGSGEKAGAETEESVLPAISKQTTPRPVRLELEAFPDQPKSGSSPPATIDNVRHLLRAHGIIARYNVIKKKTEIAIPGRIGTSDNADEVSLTRIISLANLNGVATGHIGPFVNAVADEEAFNPVREWIHSEPWDGLDRLDALCATLVEAEGYPAHLKRALLYRWLLSATAAALKSSGFHCRGVLTLQGGQSIGKTSWIAGLVDDELLRESVVKLDHHLDPHNKDSVIGAVCNWIVELGEIDSTFKRDIARMKGVLTRDSDKVRRPYDKAESEYQRRTVFAATVNRPDFLTDDTGNSRFWTIEVVSIDYQHGIDMQQVFAQLACDVEAGAQWWLTLEEEALLEAQNRKHRAISAIGEKLLAHFDLDLVGEAGLLAMTPIEVLERIGIDKPNNGQCRECGALLREYLGQPKRIQGQNRWRIPWKREEKPSKFD